MTIAEGLASRLAEGRRLTDEDVASLGAFDVISLGAVADDVRRRRHGVCTTFVRVANLLLDRGASLEFPAAAGEVRIVGTPGSLAAALDRVSEVVQAVSARGLQVPVSGFSLSDLEQLAAHDGITLRSMLEECAAAGLDLVAEAPFDLLKDPYRSIEEVNIAGLALARLTLDRLPSADASLFKGISDLQRRVAVIRAFAPLPRRVNASVPTTGYEDVKRVAQARLIVDNIPSIQVDWALYGPKLAQIALTVGADDVDAVSAAEETTEGRRRAPLEEIRRNIQAAGQEPLERDGRFEPRSR